jgi:hypothetical protein
MGTWHQVDFAFCKFANPDFGALQIGHDGHFTACPAGSFTHQLGAIDVILGFAVAEVHANHIDASANHGLEHGRIAGGWA